VGFGEKKMRTWGKQTKSMKKMVSIGEEGGSPGYTAKNRSVHFAGRLLDLRGGGTVPLKGLLLPEDDESISGGSKVDRIETIWDMEKLKSYKTQGEGGKKKRETFEFKPKGVENPVNYLKK